MELHTSAPLAGYYHNNFFFKECRAITLLAPKAGMGISPFFLFLFSEYISGIGIRMRVGIGYASVRERSANFKMKVVA